MNDWIIHHISQMTRQLFLIRELLYQDEEIKMHTSVLVQVRFFLFSLAVFSNRILISCYFSSIFFQNLLPSWCWVKVGNTLHRWPVCCMTTHSHTLTHSLTPGVNLETPINQWNMYLDCGRKTECLEKSTIQEENVACDKTPRQVLSHLYHDYLQNV